MQYVAVLATQYNSSLSSFVPNFRILHFVSQVVAEKSLTEKKSLHTDRQSDNHSYRPGKIYIPSIYFVAGVY